MKSRYSLPGRDASPRRPYHAKANYGMPLLLSPLALLTGCHAAPQINVLGSFFPAWMLSIGIGSIGTLLLRRLSVRAKFESHLSLRPLVYFCLWVLLTLGSWLVFFRV